MFGGSGFGLRAFDAQGVSVHMQRLNHAIGQCPNGFAVFRGTSDDFVVNVGDVAHISDCEARLLEPALHHIESHHGTRMAHVTKVVHRHATHIHAHMTRREGLENLQLTRKRVVNAKGHVG